MGGSGDVAVSVESHRHSHNVSLPLKAQPNVFGVSFLESQISFDVLCLFCHIPLKGEVGGWGRDPKKCTGRDWGMGSSTT